jgi:hypothetical protein
VYKKNQDISNKSCLVMCLTMFSISILINFAMPPYLSLRQLKDMPFLFYSWPSNGIIVENYLKTPFSQLENFDGTLDAFVFSNSLLSLFSILWVSYLLFYNFMRPSYFFPNKQIKNIIIIIFVSIFLIWTTSILSPLYTTNIFAPSYYKSPSVTSFSESFMILGAYLCIGVLINPVLCAFRSTFLGNHKNRYIGR